jgi:hypothetical protein
MKYLNPLLKSLMTIVIFVASFVTYYTQAQTEFAPIDAEWYYNLEWGTVYIGNPPQPILISHFNHVISEKDTIINGNNCRVLKQYYDYSDTMNERYIIKQEEGKIYYYYQNQVNLLYDFDAQINDIALFTFKYTKTDYDPPYHDKDTILSVRYRIESITTNAQNLRTFKANIIEEDMVKDHGIMVTPLIYKYIEKIGFNGNFMPILDNVEHPLIDNHEWLRCYSDSEFSYIAEWWEQESLPCDYYYSLGIISQEKEDNIKIYPNPFDNNISVSTNNGKYITILDILGKVMYHSELQNGITEISTNHFSKGVYFLKIQNKDNSVQNFKIVRL